MTQGYRKDIDGLRAIAVTTVIAFHAQWPLLRGGFIGVDVFFVISGYLMGSLIIEDVSAGRFSIVSFYERRVRRIFPALAFMLLATSLLAYLCLLPGELKDYAKSLVAATLSYSNIYFSHFTNYFNPGTSASIPLLHTWSLAVEEQFYAVLPIFVILAHRLWRRGFGLVLLAATLVSFAFSAYGAYGAYADRVSAFYLLHSRAWELLLGTLLSLRSFPRLRAPLSRNLASAAGLVLIGASAFTLSPDTNFPGIAALIPCGGAALIILAGRSGSSLTGFILSCRPLVFVGQISYSLYLWHWPIFVFMRMSELFPLGRHEVLMTLLAVLATTIVATFSWKYVEAPFRRGVLRPARWRLFELAGAAAVLLLGFGLATMAELGFPARFSKPAIAMASYLKYPVAAYMRTDKCFLLQRWEDFDPAQCLHMDDARRNYLLLGDSHAAHLWYGLSTVFRGDNFMQATAASCHPLLGREHNDLCDRLLSYVFSDFLEHHKIDGLLLASAWQEQDRAAVAQTLDWALSRGIRVILFGPIVQYDDALPRLLAFGAEDHDPGRAAYHRRDLSSLDEAMRDIADERGVEYISLQEALCDPGSCTELAAPGIPLQFDYGHLTSDGSVVVARRLRKLSLLPEGFVSIGEILRSGR
jgi:peptidoglycan/LPS O-acetylase OafA/YrhL